MFLSMCCTCQEFYQLGQSAHFKGARIDGNNVLLDMGVIWQLVAEREG